MAASFDAIQEKTKNYARNTLLQSQKEGTWSSSGPPINSNSKNTPETFTQRKD